MKENVIIVNCKVPSEAYQILSELRRDFQNNSYEISQAAIVKKAAGHVSLEDGFISGNPVDSHGFTGSLIGSLIGILGGPLGVLFGGTVGSLIGDSMDDKEIAANAALLEKASECLSDGETALLLLVTEADETALPAKLNGFQVTFTRMDAKEVATEIAHVENKQLESAEEPAALPEGDKK